MDIRKIERDLGRIRRMRWVVFGFVMVGILVSIAMNVLHAPPTVVGRVISAWPPIALFGAIELIARIPTTNRWLSAGRVIATLIVAGVTGSVSYFHMMGSVTRYGGETGWQAAIWPASVDGLMIVAALSLVEVVRKIRMLEDRLDAALSPTVTVQPATTAVEPVTPPTVTEVPAEPVSAGGVPLTPPDAPVRPRRPRKPKGTGVTAIGMDTDVVTTDSVPTMVG